MRKSLILGGAGFIGYHLACQLISQADQQITVVDNFSRGALDEDLKEFLSQYPQVELVTGDLTKSDIWQHVPGPFDHVYILAGVLGVRRVQTSPADVIYTNTAILMNTLEWVSRVGCSRLLFTSTSETYAGGVELGLVSVPTPEDIPLVVLDIKNPRSSYAMSKMLGESAVIHYAQSCGFDAVIVRYHNIYGPRMGFEHVIPELMERIWRRMDPLPVYGLEQTRAFCHVADAVAACLNLMTCPLHGCEIVNVGNDREEITIQSLLKKLLVLANFFPTIEALPASSGAVSRRCPVLNKLRQLTGFQPRVNLDRGLAQTWEWYQKRFEQIH